MNPTWITPEISSALVGMQWGFLAYFICINVVYLALNFIAMFAILRYAREHGAAFRVKNFADYQPPVSILVPAHNEERTIVSTVRSLLRLNYPNYEIVVVNDGSTDATLQTVVDAFGLQAMFGVFFVLGLVVIAFLTKFLPNTSGRSLEELEESFMAGQFR